MVDIPCLPSQTFWCLAYPNDSVKKAAGEKIEEIILAEKPEHAVRQVEKFWRATCAVILSQDEVHSLMKSMASDPIDSDGVTMPEPKFLDKLFGRKLSQGDKPQRFFVCGDGPDGAKLTALVQAKTIASAYMAATMERPGMVPASAFSESQLKELHTAMEKGRTGQAIATTALAAADHSGGIDEEYQQILRDRARKSSMGSR